MTDPRPMPHRQVHAGRAALAIIPALILLCINGAAEWAAEKSSRAFDRLLTWAGFQL